MKPNIVVIVLDTARRSNAYAETVMPELASIVNDRSTTQYTNANTSAPWTLPSHASLFTGQLTSVHGTHAATKRFSPTVPTLADRLQSNGYETRAYSNNLWVNPTFGFGDGFDHFDRSWLLINSGVDVTNVAKNHETTAEQARALIDTLSIKTAPHSLLNAAYTKFLRKRYDKGSLVTTWKINRWLKQRNRSSPFFLFANLLEPHQPYDPPKKHAQKHVPEGVTREEALGIPQDAWKYIAGQLDLSEDDFEALRGLYNGELSYVDQRVKQIYDRLSKTGQLDETIFVVCGDHGENIGDHGLMDHQYSVHDTLLNVPLVVRYPDAIREQYPEIADRGEQANDRLIELRDLYATMIDAATDPDTDPREVLVDSGLEGQSPHSLLRAAARDHVVAEYRTPQPSIKAIEDRTGVRKPVEKYDRALRTIKTEEWKFVERTDGSRSLYTCNGAANETEDVSSIESATADSMQDWLTSEYGALLPPREDCRHSESSEPTTANDVPDEVQQRLEELGYI